MLDGERASLPYPSENMNAAFVSLLAALPALGAILSGTVTDAAGKPIPDARVDHISSKAPVSVVVAVGAPPVTGEVRSDADGRFEVTTEVAAVVVRKAGYTSQRILINGDNSVNIVLQPIHERWACKVSPRPQSKAAPANDVDFTGRRFYLKTKDGRTIGFMSGSGPTYSFGAPSNSEVWKSTEYREVMYESGLIEA